LDIDPAMVLLGEISQWRRKLAGAQPHIARVITNNIAALEAEYIALFHPELATPTPAAEEHAGEKSVGIDLNKLPVWARDIVREHLDRKDAERAEAERQAVEAARIAHEADVTAHFRASLTAPQMGHLRSPRRLTRIVSTESQRLAAIVRQNRVEEARLGTAANHLGPRESQLETAPIPRASMTGLVV
jgi:hypothetical protein